MIAKEFIGAVVLCVVSHVNAHGAMTIPPPRNAIDRTLAPWNGTVPAYPLPFMFWCAKPSSNTSDPRNLTGENGQACFWFSNGCDISCDACDGTTGQLIHPEFTANESAPGSWWSGKDIRPAAKQTNPGHRAICPNNPNKLNATICDPQLRTINMNAECGGPDDFYYYAPWRRPGAAPVIDACGVAGGRFPGQGAGAAGADYHSTPLAARGDKGSLLPKQPSGTVWEAGTAVDVAWTVKAFHGGGYSYRLCPADRQLTEECFQSYPLKFVGQQSFRWGGEGGKQEFFNGTYVSEGTTPKGSMWAKNPVPRGPWGWMYTGQAPEPKCQESPACANAHTDNPPFMTCKCSGDSIGDIPTLEIVDKVQLPSDLAPGDWVVGWRWDCEESTQIWSSCGDVTITKPKQ